MCLLCDENENLLQICSGSRRQNSNQTIATQTPWSTTFHLMSCMHACMHEFYLFVLNRSWILFYISTSIGFRLPNVSFRVFFESQIIYRFYVQFFFLLFFLFFSRYVVAFFGLNFSCNTFSKLFSKFLSIVQSFDLVEFHAKIPCNPSKKGYQLSSHSSHGKIIEFQLFNNRMAHIIPENKLQILIFTVKANACW